MEKWIRSTCQTFVAQLTEGYMSAFEVLCYFYSSVKTVLSMLVLVGNLSSY